MKTSLRIFRELDSTSTTMNPLIFIEELIICWICTHCRVCLTLQYKRRKLARLELVLCASSRVQVDLGSPHTIRGWKVRGDGQDSYVRLFRLLFSLDGVTWIPYSDGRVVDKVTPRLTTPQLLFISPFSLHSAVFVSTLIAFILFLTSTSLYFNTLHFLTSYSVPRFSLPPVTSTFFTSTLFIPHSSLTHFSFHILHLHTFHSTFFTCTLFIPHSSLPHSSFHTLHFHTFHSTFFTYTLFIPHSSLPHFSFHILHFHTFHSTFFTSTLFTSTLFTTTFFS